MKLESVRIEVAANGFTVEVCGKEERKKKGGDSGEVPMAQDDYKREEFVFESSKSVLAKVAEVLNADGGDELDRYFEVGREKPDMTLEEATGEE